MHRFASIILVDQRGWILLQERDENPVIDPDRWGFVGGHVEDGENADDAAYRELEEETGLRLTEPALTLWREATVFHEAYGTHDSVRVYVGSTEFTDADITVGEGRAITFVDPAVALNLPLGTSAAQILPDFVNSNFYQEFLP